MASDSPRPSYRHERKAALRGVGVICGIDEAGRGPWAGPVVAAAVILDPARLPRGVNDSKVLEPERREALYHVIVERAEIGVGIVEVDRIDAINILQATFAAMAEAVLALARQPAFAFIDGNRAPKLPCETQTIIAGDAKCLSIAAASIIAKVTRDRLMVTLDALWPGYGFARHKGYGTPEHQDALKRLGPCVHHRRSFAPIRACLAGEAIIPDAELTIY
jgi:ribonuclease HII